jgi:hypothetical protein
MISEKQLDANRRNARNSTGPTTAKGKRNSSHNAVRHGFTGHVVILTPEDREAHDKFCDELIESLQPETAIERQIAHAISEDYWRTNRLRAAENNIFAKASAGSQSEIGTALDTADAFLREAKQLQLLTLYEQRINRAIQKNMDQLRALQTERKAESKQQMDEAMLLAQLSLSKGMPYDPAIDFPAIGRACALAALSPQESGQRRQPLVSGFVYSSAEINRAIDRNNRLNEAKNLGTRDSSRGLTSKAA